MKCSRKNVLMGNAVLHIHFRPLYVCGKASQETNVLGYKKKGSLSHCYCIWFVFNDTVLHSLCVFMIGHKFTYDTTKEKSTDRCRISYPPSSCQSQHQSYKVILLLPIYINKHPYHKPYSCQPPDPQTIKTFTQTQHHHNPLTTSRTAQTSLEKSKNHYLTRQ